MPADALCVFGLGCVHFVSCCLAAARLYCQHGVHATLVIDWLPTALHWHSAWYCCQLAYPFTLECWCAWWLFELPVSFDPSWNTDQGVWCMCKLVCVCPWAQWKWQLGNLHQQPTDQLREVWVWVHALGPERWWTMLEKNEFRGNSDGGSQRYWRANRSSYLGIGAKD